MTLLLASLILAANTTGLVPLNDLGPHEYRWGYVGGLYDDKTNNVPADHAADGLVEAAQIQPLDENGQPDPNGKIGFLSVGYGNTQLTFDQFIALAASDPHVNPAVVFANGAAPNEDVMQWEQPWQPVYDRVLNEVLAPAGLTEEQVQVVWMQQINQNPFTPLPVQYADSYLVKASMANTLRALKTHYPNLRVAYLSSPEYAGYDTGHFLGEPYAYEDGLAVRWVVTGQIDYMRIGEMWDPRISDLSYKEGKAPWVTWGPYLWADGTNPRSDGLTWQRTDFSFDGVTLSENGAKKSAGLLMKFLLEAPTAANWFMSTEQAPTDRRRSARR